MKGKNATVLTIILVIIAIVGAGYSVYPRLCNDYLAGRDARRTAKPGDPGSGVNWIYVRPDIQKMSLRAVASYCPDALWTECFYRADPKQKEALVAAYPYDGSKDWLYDQPREEWLSCSNTRRCLEIMHVIPTSDKHLSLEKAYEILSGYVPKLVSRLEVKDDLDVSGDPHVGRGELTQYEVYLRIIKRLNAYAICEDRSSSLANGARYAEYDLTDEGDLSLIVYEYHFNNQLCAYVEDKAHARTPYLIYSSRAESDEQLKDNYDLTYYIPLGNGLS